MIKKIAKYVGFTLILGYLSIAGMIYHVGKQPAVYRDVSVVICDSAELSFLKASDIYNIMKQNKISPYGKRIEEFDTQQLTRCIAQNKLIRDVRCYHTPDSILRVDIFQRHPIMRVKNNVGKDYYIDTEGNIMPVQTGIAIYLPIATGNISNEMAQNELYEFAKFLNHDSFWRSAITQINVKADGDVELIPRVGSHIILLGSFDNFQNKLDNLYTFYQKVLNVKGWNLYKTINIKFQGQVIGEK